MIRAAVSVLALLASGCARTPTADPAKEAPVDPAAGLYDISISAGGPFGGAQGAEKQKPVCLKAADAARFGDRLAEKFAKLQPICSIQTAPRQGNVFSGDVRCAADPKLAQGANRFAYRGVIARESVTIEVQIKFEAAPIKGGDVDTMEARLAMKAMEHMRFVVKAIRTGDCA